MFVQHIHIHIYIYIYSYILNILVISPLWCVFDPNFGGEYRPPYIYNHIFIRYVYILIQIHSHIYIEYTD
jgi:hypothetical protein